MILKCKHLLSIATIMLVAIISCSWKNLLGSLKGNSLYVSNPIKIIPTKYSPKNFYFLKSRKYFKTNMRGSWVAQSAECPTPDFGSGQDLS